MLDTIAAAPVMPPPARGASAARKVVSLCADAATQEALAAWAAGHGFDLAAGYGGTPRPAADFEFHVTLLATVEPVDMPDGSMAISPVTVTPAGFGALGEDGGTPVLLLDDHDGLTCRRDAILALTGATPTYADFLPHITLSYAWTGTPVLEHLAIPEFPLVFDHIKVGTLYAPAPAVKRASSPSAVPPPDILGPLDDIAAALEDAAGDPSVVAAAAAALDRLGADTDIYGHPDADAFSQRFDELSSVVARLAVTA